MNIGQDTANELICEMILRWRRREGDSRGQVWTMPATDTYREREAYTPEFTSWADAGLILDALQAQHVDVKLMSGKGAWCVVVDGTGHWFESGPLAVRQAALGFLHRPRGV